MTDIRMGVADDAEAVMGIWAAVAAEAEWIGTELPLRPGWSDRFRAAIADEASCWFVADVDGQAVGAIFLRDEGGLADLGMAITSPHRGQGLGRALLDCGVAWARDRGCHKVVLEVWPHNEGARRLYTTSGFVEEGRRVRHYRRRNGALWDAVAMGLVLDHDSPGRS